jgi:hypothetical protein
MINITPSELLAFQLEHYTRRLGEARSVEERSFIRGELFRLKNLNKES